MATTQQELTALFEPVVSAMGYELVGIDYRSNPNHGLLRIYIDQEGGVTADDCAKVSHQVSGILDVEDPIKGHYVLEVSSPGIDRPLFTMADYEKYVGNTVRVQLKGGWEGRKKVVGVLLGVSVADESIEIDETGERRVIPLSEVSRANLVAEV